MLIRTYHQSMNVLENLISMSTTDIDEEKERECELSLQWTAVEGLRAMYVTQCNTHCESRL